MNRTSAFTLVAVCTAFTGCNSGSSGAGGTISPLEVPTQMTVIAANDAQAGSLRLNADPLRMRTREGVAAITGSPYETDPVRLYVHDESMEVLGTINGILTMLGQTGYADPAVLNQGPYIALVEDAMDDNKGGDPSNGGQATTDSSVRLMEWTVRSDRASASAPHIVQFWIDWEEDRGDGGGNSQSRIYGKLTITEAPSEAAPYGIFTLNYKMLPRNVAPDTAPMMNGTLVTLARNDGRAEYAFYESQGDYDTTPPPGEQVGRTRARVIAEPNGTSGSAYTNSSWKYNDNGSVMDESSEYHVAFNSGYMARRTVAGSQTIDVYNRNSYQTFPWRYGLYDATTEARVSLNAGFPIKTGDGARGYAGYHGIWFPHQVTISNGMSVTRDGGEQNSGDTYTVFVAPGKLVKRTRSATTLGNLRNEPLYWFDQGSQQNVTVNWTGTDLVKVATFDRMNNAWQDVDPPVSIVSSFSASQWVGFHSPARGELNFVWPNGSLSDSTPVSAWGETTLNSDAPELANGDLTLHSYFRSLRPNISQTMVNFSGGQSPYFTDATNTSNGQTYTFTRTGLVLQHGGQGVTLLDGVSLDNSPFGNGLMSGSMVTSPLTALSDLANQDTTYRWQIGTQSWNQLRALRDTQGAFVAFDSPMTFNYTHNEPSNTRWHGRTFRLEYQGFGQLHGIPFEQVAGTNRWYPVFRLANGTVLTNNSGSYKVKVLEAEQKMTRESDPTGVIAREGLDVNTSLTPPANTWADPAIGAKPAVTAAPLFVRGVRQSGS